MEIITVISSVEIEYSIIGICHAIVIVSIFLFVLDFDKSARSTYMVSIFLPWFYRTTVLQRKNYPFHSLSVQHNYTNDWSVSHVEDCASCEYFEAFEL